MSLRPSSIPPVPKDTVRVAHLAFLKGKRYLTFRDLVGTIFRDSDFQDLFSDFGQSAISSAQLVLISIMQFLEDIIDCQAAEAGLLPLHGKAGKPTWKAIYLYMLLGPMQCNFGAKCLIAHSSPSQLF